MILFKEGTHKDGDGLFGTDIAEDPQKEKCRVSILNIIMIDNQKNKLMLSLRYRELRFAI